MFLKKLKLTNFRNYIGFDHEFNKQKTIIIGQNAQGKSNILEAINLLATSESNKAEKDNELICWDKDFALICANIDTGRHNETPIEIALQINPTGRRKLKINGVSKNAPQADLLGNFFAVMFSCDDLYLIKGTPGTRRRWLDTVLFQLDIKYHKTLQNYQKSITQKNTLLKKNLEEGIPKKELKDQLEIWNEQIINFGTEIINSRVVFIRETEIIAKEFLNSISKKTEELSLIYESTISYEDNKTKIKHLFKEKLHRSFEDEIIRGQSLIGPHRDDLIFLINEKNAKSFASQGQQRSIILAIKLAELKVIEKRKNEIPVLLLDDVFAEIDESRQDFLLHNLPENIQLFLTTTHISDIQKELLKGAEILEVNEGRTLEKHNVK